MSSTPTVHHPIHDPEDVLPRPSGVPGSSIPKSKSKSKSAHLPPGCTFGPLVRLQGKYLRSISPSTKIPSSSSSSPSASEEGQGEEIVRAIYVDFEPLSPVNPYYFSKGKKIQILVVAFFFAHITASATSSYSIGFDSMKRDLGMSSVEAAAGVSLYGWGFAIGPLVLAPLTEEFGRFWFYIGSTTAFMLLQMTGSLARNIETVLIGRFLLGIAGSIGATVVAGTVSDLYTPPERGLPMSLFTLFVTIGPGLAPVLMCWVEANASMQWRWISWIQMIATGIYIPICYFVLRETRAPVLLQRRAKALRKERGMADGGRYTTRAEVDKAPFWEKLRTSLSRPLLFLIFEPVVTFFAIWAALVWGVFFMEVAGLPAVFKTVHNFTITQSGLTYLAVFLGTVLGFVTNFAQDAIYKRRVAFDGVEARLYAAMGAGIAFAVGCIIFGLTAIPSVTWVAPCIGIIILMAGAFHIYQCCFIYLAECYGSHASSAVAGMSFLRICLGSSFAMFTNQAFDTLTPRWALFMMGCIGIPLAGVPFLAFYRGKWIRDRSPYSKKLMAEERTRVAVERGDLPVEVLPEKVDP